MHAIVWRNTEDIMVSDIIQSQKNMLWFHVHEVLRGVGGWEGGGTSVHCESEMTGLCFLLLWDMKCVLPTQLCRARLILWPPVTVRGASTPHTPKSKFNILIKSKHSKSQETMNRTLVLQTLRHSWTSHILLWTVLFLLKCCCWTFLHCEEQCNMGQQLWMQYGASSKMKNTFTTWPSHATLGIYPNELTIGFKDIFVHLCSLAALFTIAESWKQPRCPSMKEWINTMWLYIQWNIIQR